MPELGLIPAALEVASEKLPVFSFHNREKLVASASSQDTPDTESSTSVLQILFDKPSTIGENILGILSHSECSTLVFGNNRNDLVSRWRLQQDAGSPDT